MGRTKVPERASQLTHAQGPPLLREFPSQASAPSQISWNKDWGCPRSSKPAVSTRRVWPVSRSSRRPTPTATRPPRLLGLLAALPTPTGTGERFWSNLRRSSGTAHLLPTNIKDLVLRSLAGEGTGPAGQILSALDEMTPPNAWRPQR